jgi:hypothetical protein
MAAAISARLLEESGTTNSSIGFSRTSVKFLPRMRGVLPSWRAGLLIHEQVLATLEVWVASNSYTLQRRRRRITQVEPE